MGQKKSVPRPSSPEPPRPPKQSPPRKLTNQWRPYISWTPKFEQDLLTEIKNIDPKEQPNLLIIGPVGSGKSSLINAIISIGKGRKYAMASIGDTGNTSSCTSDYEGYTHAELLRGYNLMDSMGFEPNDHCGFHPDDIVFLLKGHVQRGYTFNPISPINEANSKYIHNPTLSDQCHCVVLVASATLMHSGISQDYVEKIKLINERIRREHIPRVLILTKVDQLCDEVKVNIENLFKSIKVKRAVEVASEVFGIDQASIHPVKNYEVDYNVEFRTNIPLLLALRQTMHYASDRVEFMLSKENTTKSEYSHNYMYKS